METCVEYCVPLVKGITLVLLSLRKGWRRAWTFKGELECACGSLPGDKIAGIVKDSDVEL